MDPKDKLTKKPAPPQPTNGAKGARQRLRIYVPTAQTVMSMGDTDARNGQYNGFGVHTSGHVLYSAMGPKATDSRLTFESMGNMVIQSTDGSMFMGAKNVVSLVAGENLLVGGAGGLLVHGGSLFDMSVPKPDTRVGDVPHLAHSWHHADHNYAIVKKVWEAADALFCVYETNVARVNAKNEAKAKGRRYVLTYPLAQAAVGVVAGGVGAAVGHTGTIIHGDSGVIVGSPGFTSISSGASTTLGSVGGIFIAAPYFEAYGLKAAEVVSKRNVSLDGGKIVELLAKEDVVLASRRDQAHLDGKNITIGGLSSAGSQAETKSVTYSASEVVSVQGSKLVLEGKDVAGVSSKRVNLGGQKFVSLGSSEMVVFSVGNSQFVLQDNKVMMGRFTKKIDPPPERASFPSSGGHHYSEQAAEAIKARAEKAAGFVDGYTPPTPGGSFIQMTDKDVLIQCKGHKVKGSAAGWKVPKMKIMP